MTSNLKTSLWLVFPHQLFDQLPEGVETVAALQGRKIAMVSRIYEMRKSEFAKEEKARVLKTHSRPAKAKSKPIAKSKRKLKSASDKDSTAEVHDEVKTSPIEKKKGKGKKQ